MFGSYILSSILGIISTADKHPSGDIMSIANFMIHLSNRINLKLINEKNIRSEVKKINFMQGKQWLPTLVRVLRYMKKLMTKMSVYESKDWSLV